MTTTPLRHVLRAPTLREAVQRIPDAFFERTALGVLGCYVVLPLPLWWLGPFVGLDIGLLRWTDLHVGFVALALGLLLLARRRTANLDPLRDPRHDNVPMLLFGAFLVLALVASLISPTPETWVGDGYRGESILTYVSYVGFFFLATQVLAPVHRRALLLLVLGLVVTTCVTTLASSVFGGLSAGDWTAADRAGAYFHNFNHYGYLLCVGGAVAASGALVAPRTKERYGLFAAYGLITLTLLLNDTLGAYLALIAGCIVVIVGLAIAGRLRAKSAWSLVAVAVAVHLFVGWLGGGVLTDLVILGGDVRAVSSGMADAGSAGSGRWELWETTVEQIAASPWIGHGVEGIAELLGETGRTHNEYLQYAVFFGIPASLAYLAAVVVVLARVIRRAARVSGVTIVAAAGATTYLISAGFGNTMYYTSPVFFILLGLAWCGVRSLSVPTSA